MDPHHQEHIAADHLPAAATEAHHHRPDDTAPHRRRPGEDPLGGVTAADPISVTLATATAMCTARGRIRDRDRERGLIRHDREARRHHGEEAGGAIGIESHRPVGDGGGGVRVIRAIRAIVIGAAVGIELGGDMDAIGRGEIQK